MESMAKMLYLKFILFGNVRNSTMLLIVTHLNKKKLNFQPHKIIIMCCNVVLLLAHSYNVRQNRLYMFSGVNDE